MSLDLETVYRCPVCGVEQSPVGNHIRQQHGEQAFVQAVLDAKRAGMSDAKIGEQFGITFKQLERIITKAVGVNVSTLSHPKRIKSWEPIDFRLESTTVWSFKQRGSWATHDGRYRGNWSPYIPRNLILRYTNPGDLVLDPFVGGGTTAVEAKLLGRRCIARDINPVCVGMTLENLRFSLPRSLFEESPIYEPEVSVGDARCLKGIADNSVDLICAHPPYAGIIQYTSSIEGDLSQLSVPEFLHEMRQVASECYRVLKPGSNCAVLIGDTRQHKHVVPIGFKTIEVFLEAGFRLKELVIKRQHNCKTTGFWANRSVEHNFLLLAHEYLPVFEKPFTDVADERFPRPSPVVETLIPPKVEASVETTTVWIFPRERLREQVDANLSMRYGDIVRIELNIRDTSLDEWYSHTNFLDAVGKALYSIRGTGFLAIEAKDIRFGGRVIPIAMLVVDTLQSVSRLWLKEIIVVLPGDVSVPSGGDELEIVHRYLLVYEVLNDEKNDGKEVFVHEV